MRGDARHSGYGPNAASDAIIPVGDPDAGAGRDQVSLSTSLNRTISSSAPAASLISIC